MAARALACGSVFLRCRVQTVLKRWAVVRLLQIFVEGLLLVRSCSIFRL